MGILAIAGFVYALIAGLHIGYMLANDDGIFLTFRVLSFYAGLPLVVGGGYTLILFDDATHPIPYMGALFGAACLSYAFCPRHHTA